MLTAALTWFLAKLGPKLLGVLLDKAMKAMERLQARQDLKDSVRKGVEIESLKLANRAYRYLADHPDLHFRVREGGGTFEILPSPPRVEL